MPAHSRRLSRLKTGGAMDNAGQTKRRVLIVDDDPTIRRLFRATLAAEYELHEAANGEEALAMAASREFDLVLLDIMMPGLGGHRTCRRLKATPERAPQIIMVSARSSPEEQVEAFAMGADDYLVKPVNHCELRSRVKLQVR